MLLHDLILRHAEPHAARPALTGDGETVTYGGLAERILRATSGLLSLGLQRTDRIAIRCDKNIETVVACFAASLAGAIFVPVSPLAKTRQVAHILSDSGARALVTSSAGARAIAPALECPELRALIITDDQPLARRDRACPTVLPWSELSRSDPAPLTRPGIDADIAAIFYTSGSTGQPKGVVLSQRNLVAGATSVADYLENSPEDVVLAALPLSFDAGFSQLTTSFLVGAHAVLHSYLLPRDLLSAVARHEVTGLAGVPALWNQVARVEWPDSAANHLRYLTNTGGVMPRQTLARLRGKAPGAKIYLMYGLTEAFRSTYLPPREIDRRPSSIGKAIPNAEVLVARPDGSPCAPGEPGELIHRGVHVAQGYWNAPDLTAERFRPAPGQPAGLPLPELAVWSGDIVRADEEGFLYFEGRNDDMIKCSGYRVSPTEVEDVVYEVDAVTQCVAFGVSHPELGQAVVMVYSSESENDGSREAILQACSNALPAYMVPKEIIREPELPQTAHGKVDRRALAGRYAELFAGVGAQ